MIDLDVKTQRQVRRILDRYLPETEVRLVGSRARKGAKRQADIDLLVMRSKPLLPRERALLNTAFEESDIPFKVDVIEWELLTATFRLRLLEGGMPLFRSPVGAEGRAESRLDNQPFHS